MKTLVISDIHANKSALEAILDKENTWDKCIFLGDAVISGPEPDEVLSILKSLDCITIMGNHDKEVLELDSDEFVVNPVKKWAQWQRKNISHQNLTFLAGFAEESVVLVQGVLIKAIHGVLPDAFGKRLWPDSPLRTFQYLSRKHTESCILVGHSHVQFDCTHGNTRFINPGSAGAPYLGHPLACYAVIQDGQVDLRATTYDIDKTCQVMMERAEGIVDDDFITDWIHGWRTGTLPKRYFIRDYSQLRQLGYR